MPKLTKKDRAKKGFKPYKGVSSNKGADLYKAIAKKQCFKPYKGVSSNTSPL